MEQQTPSPSSDELRETFARRSQNVSAWITGRGVDLDPVNLPDIITSTKFGALIGDKGWVLSGGVGSGKTVRARLASEYAAIPMTTAAEIVEQASVNVCEINKLGCAGNLPAGLDIVSRAKEYDLIIDDLGTEPAQYSAWGIKRDLMAEVLLARLNLWPHIRTFVTTNLNKQELMKRYGERVCSRLFQATMWVPVIHTDRRAI